MKIRQLHPWEISYKEAITIQNQLQGQLIPELVEVEKATAIGEAQFPYVPGLLSFREVLEAIEDLDVDDQAYILDTLSKRLIESRRVEIAKRAEEAEQAYREGKVKRGSFEDLWKDLDKTKTAA